MASIAVGALCARPRLWEVVNFSCEDSRFPTADLTHRLFIFNKAVKATGRKETSKVNTSYERTELNKTWKSQSKGPRCHLVRKKHQSHTPALFSARAGIRESA